MKRKRSEGALRTRSAARRLPDPPAAHQGRAVYLCGESFGGCLAQKVIMHAKGLIERLILINPASSFKLYPWMSLGEPITRALPSALYRVSKLGILPFLADWGRVADWEVRALWSAIHSVPQTTFIWRLSLLGEFDISETQLSCITQPTLLLASGADRLLPSVKEAQRLNSCLPKAQMVVLSDSCHACLLERSVDLYQILQTHNFLSSGNAVSLVRGAS
ncbi:MAG: alpha/beta hydrolase [Hormoscilla sp. GM7CHS1pb]|nr:alpha/beta hydrolase [Hormoscilla sp. GM7CHS1pb]